MANLIRALLLSILFVFPVYARVVSVATHPQSKETLSLYNEQRDCPDGSLFVVYHDPRRDKKAEGCYFIHEDNVVSVFSDGFLSVPIKMFKPEI